MTTKRSRQSILSTALLALSALLFALVGLLYLRDRADVESPPLPTARPGRNELVHVTEALEGQGLAVETLPGNRSVRSEMLEGAGQAITVDGVPLYVFIYAPDAAAREEATLDVEAEDVDLTSTTGKPVDGGPLRLFTGSNVALVLVGGSDELAAKVEQALATLP